MIHFDDKEKILAVDCDDTLVIYDDNQWEGHKDFDQTIKINNGEFIERVMPHFKHIAMIKRFKFLGYKIIVWSGTGGWWPKKLVEILGLEPYVDMTMSKPLFHCDDSDKIEAIVGRRVYLNRK